MADTWSLVSRFLIGTVALLLAVSGLVALLSDAAWVGHSSISLEFLILDASTGKSIEGAKVQLVEGQPEYEATTGLGGRAKFVVDAVVGGRDSLFRRTRAVNYAWALAVDRDRYRAVFKDLREFTRDVRYHSDSEPPPIVIRLEQAR